MRSGKKSTLRHREAIAGHLFILPFMAGSAFFYVAPFLISAFHSFVQKAEGTVRFAGLSNYAVLAQNWAFRLAMRNTLLFITAGVCLLLLAGFGLALLLHRPWIKSRLFRSASLFPMILPGASLVLAWQLFFQDSGVINRYLILTRHAPVYFFDTGAGIWLVVLLFVWKNAGYIMVLFMTGISQIPREMYEAAMLDGIGPLRRVRYITLPCIRPTIYLTVLIALLNAQKIFREVYYLAGSYPYEGLYMLQHYMNNNFDKLDLTRLSTAAMFYCGVLLFVLVPLFAIERKSFTLE